MMSKSRFRGRTARLVRRALPLQPKGRGRILVIDDEVAVRRSAASILERLGYAVESVDDGKKAVELYADARESAHPFDAVVMDLTIPGGMGGRETLKKLRETDPAAKVILSSTYGDDPATIQMREYGFVATPYTIEQMDEALHEVATRDE